MPFSAQIPLIQPLLYCEKQCVQPGSSYISRPPLSEREELGQRRQYTKNDGGDVIRSRHSGRMHHQSAILAVAASRLRDTDRLLLRLRGELAVYFESSLTQESELPSIQAVVQRANGDRFMILGSAMAAALAANLFLGGITGTLSSSYEFLALGYVVICGAIMQVVIHDAHWVRELSFSKR